MSIPNNYYLLTPDTLVLQWPNQIDPYIAKEIFACIDTIRSLDHKAIKEYYPAYTTLAIQFDTTATSAEQLLHDLQQHSSTLTPREPLIWTIPVCYDPAVAPDLLAFAKTKKLKLDELVEKHTAPEYLVHFMGFLPGFMYLGGLDEALHLPRKSTPAASVPKGAVAIGGGQTGIYPSASPGGWNVIGQTPVSFFEPKDQSPTFVRPGDYLKFESISHNTFKIYSIEAECGILDLDHNFF